MTRTPSAPVLKWPGAKWNIAEWIIAHMPRHDCYIEPYFGSGAVFFSKEPSNVELLNDIDGTVVNFFRVVRDCPEELAALIELTPWARDEYDECRFRMGQGDEVERARRLMVAMWQGVGLRCALPSKSGIVSNGWRKRDRLHQSPLPTWQRLPDRIHVAAKRLHGAQIENRPALDVVTQHRAREVLIYADPPYHPDTRGRRLYAHEMNDEEHAALLEALCAHPGPVLLSGYDNKRYQRRLRHWKSATTQVRVQSGGERTEILWLNPLAWERLQREKRTLPMNFEGHL